MIAHVSKIREVMVFISKDSGDLSRSGWVNAKNPTHSKTFCDRLDLGSLWDSRRYTWDRCNWRVEKTLKTHVKKDSLKKMKLNWWTFLFRRDLLNAWNLRIFPVVCSCCIETLFWLTLENSLKNNHTGVSFLIKYPLFVTSTSTTKCYPWPLLFSDNIL